MILWTLGSLSSCTDRLCVPPLSMALMALNPTYQPIQGQQSSHMSTPKLAELRRKQGKGTFWFCTYLRTTCTAPAARPQLKGIVSSVLCSRFAGGGSKTRMSCCWRCWWVYSMDQTSYSRPKTAMHHAVSLDSYLYGWCVSPTNGSGYGKRALDGLRMSQTISLPCHCRGWAIASKAYI